VKGRVDHSGRALVTVSIRAAESSDGQEVAVWIDTGFNGDLVLPQSRIDELELRASGTVRAILADGSDVVLQRYCCVVDWFGELRDLEVVANDGEYPLLGVGLLLGHELHIDYRAGTVTIE